MSLKNIFIGSTCAGVIFVGGAGIGGDLIKTKDCVGELELVEYSFNRFENLSAENFTLDVLKRNNLEDKIDTALVVSMALTMLDTCRVETGFENYSAQQSFDIQNYAKAYAIYSAIESTKLNSELFKLYDVGKLN